MLELSEDLFKDDKGEIKLSGNKAGLAQAAEILLVDDVFSTGKTADTVLNVLKQHGMSANTLFKIACVLRIPPQRGGSNQDIADKVEKIFGNKES